ncbi:MAG: hypothetical protein OXN17_22785 [Candidatus Poribacteria bacterium]|nr:hypothetical protein [Candidatus Poribacteria bacterium]
MMKLQNTFVMWAAILTVIFVQSGCEKKGANRSEQESTHERHTHHEHTAPHGGTLVVLGEEFAHVEFVLEETTGKLTAYVLDGEAEKPIRLTEKTIGLNVKRLNSEKARTLQLKAVANVLTGETEGDTSQFEGQSDELAGVTEFHAEIASIVVKGQTFTHVDFNFPEGNEGQHEEHEEHHEH